MDESLKQLINGLGALAEMNYVVYSAHLKAGFSKNQALELTKVFYNVTIINSLAKGDDKNE